MIIRKILGIFILCAAIMCPGIPLQAQEPSVPQDILVQAETYADNGDTSRALSLLRQFVLEYPDAEQTPAAYAQLSRILLEEERLEQARLYAARIPVSQRPHDITLLLAHEYLEQKDSATVEEMLSGIEKGDLSSPQLLEYMQLQAKLALQRGELLQVLVHCDRVLQSPEANENMLGEAFRIAHKALTRMDPMAREESSFMFAETPVADLVKLYRLEEHNPGGDEPGSAVYRKGEDLVRSSDYPWIRQRALAWLDQVEGRPWRQRALGVVLPLSGRYAPFGEMVKQGVELALAQQKDTNIELIVRDSRADADHTEEVMQELLESQRVLAVVGPMMGEPATRAAEVAQDCRVPIILLSHWEGLPQLGSYVFRHSLTARQQTQALVDYAVHILGLETFALLQPENELGNNFSRHFRSALEKEGGEVLYHRSYPPRSTDFRAALKPMSPPEEDKEGEIDTLIETGQEMIVETGLEIEGEMAEEEQEPELEFDALFIPDFADTIALLAPQLAFSDIEGAQLLGINGWNSTDLLNQAGRYVRGAVFTDGFDPGSSDIFVQNFVTRYRQRYTEVPTILAAQAYDAASLLAHVLRDPRVTQPRQLRPKLREFDYTGGVSGLRGFDVDGEAERDIVLFKFGRKEIEIIDPAALQPVELEEFTAPEFE